MANYGEKMMYGRGMPRPIAEVTSTTEKEWQTIGSRHAATVQHLQPIAEVTSTAEERMAN
ncbi:hypothetical protein EVA_04582 [gut metagenome]|uniref:Uncharacterized protein n=1 Tax=gut metagenome TaxID=749906 RepID=J9GWD1_9ZZZZ